MRINDVGLLATVIPEADSLQAGKEARKQGDVDSTSQ